MINDFMISNWLFGTTMSLSKLLESVRIDKWICKRPLSSLLIIFVASVDVESIGMM